LQEEQLILLTYIAILIARLFQIFIAIIAYFNLKIKQFDVINAFANAKRLVSSLLVACQLLDGFKILKICAKIDRALYKLKDSLAL
jgi:hypothetical protein